MLTSSSPLSSLSTHRPPAGTSKTGAAAQGKDSAVDSTSSRDDFDATGDDFRSARSSDTAHDLEDEAGDDEDDLDRDTSSLTGEELLEEQRRAEAAEDEVLHMTELLSKRRESEARRHLMLAEMEADMERDHRLRAAATAMALAAVSNLSPARKARAHRLHTHAGRCTRHARHTATVALANSQVIDESYGRLPGAAYREEDMVISITKSEFSFFSALRSTFYCFVL